MIAVVTDDNFIASSDRMAKEICNRLQANWIKPYSSTSRALSLKDYNHSTCAAEYASATSNTEANAYMRIAN